MFPRTQATSVLALLAIGATGCAAHAGSSQLPSWYLAESATYPAREYAVGRAGCGEEVAAEERLACAMQRATEEALLQVRAHVTTFRARSCRLDTTRSQSDGQASVGAQSMCNTALSGTSEASLDVSNAVPREQSCDARHCYALVAFSRSQLAGDLELRSADQRSQFEQLLARAQSIDLLSGLTLLGEAEALAEPLDETAVTLAALRAGEGISASYRARLSEARRARMLGASVCLRAETREGPTAERIFAAASALLSEQGMDKVQLAAGCQTGSLLIDYTANSENVPVAALSISAGGLWTVSYAGSVRVSTADGSIARERAVQGRGVARSVEIARRDAEDRLAGAVRDAIAELLLAHAA